MASLLVAALGSAPSRAAELPWTQQDALHELSIEAAHCSAYYIWMQKCVENSGKADLSAQLQHAYDLSSKILFESGKSSGMTNDALLASLKLAMGSIKDSTNNSCVNLSVVLDRYGNFCKALVGDPGARLNVLQKGEPSDVP